MVFVRTQDLALKLLRLASSRALRYLVKLFFYERFDLVFELRHMAESMAFAVWIQQDDWASSALLNLSNSLFFLGADRTGLVELVHRLDVRDPGMDASGLLAIYIEVRQPEIGVGLQRDWAWWSLESRHGLEESRFQDLDVEELGAVFVPSVDVETVWFDDLPDQPTDAKGHLGLLLCCCWLRGGSASSQSEDEVHCGILVYGQYYC